MANYAKIRRDAVTRRKELQGDLERARRTVQSCEREIKVLDQIVTALEGVDGRGMGKVKGGRPAKAAGRRRKGGKWRKGHPGRPPKWYVEQQKAEGGGKKKARRGRKPGLRRRKPAAAAPAPAAPAAPEATS